MSHDVIFLLIGIVLMIGGFLSQNTITTIIGSTFFITAYLLWIGENVVEATKKR